MRCCKDRRGPKSIPSFSLLAPFSPLHSPRSLLGWPSGRDSRRAFWDGYARNQIRLWVSVLENLDCSMTSADVTDYFWEPTGMGWGGKAAAKFTGNVV